MGQDAIESGFGPAVAVEAAPVEARTLLVCEHASRHVPDRFHGLGLSEALLSSHIAWDPGALGVARALSARLSAPLVHGTISRLIYDCNRPPEAPDAVPARSETHDVPGNTSLTPAARQARVDHVYAPFRDRLAAEIASRRAALQLLVTVHSFTPVYRGQNRPVQLGILHGRDDRFAQAMLAHKPAALDWDTRVNEPYGPADGVTHTLEVQGTANGLLNVMLEIRNDLIAEPVQQAACAEMLAPWISGVLAQQSEDAA